MKMNKHYMAILLAHAFLYFSCSSESDNPPEMEITEVVNEPPTQVSNINGTSQGSMVTISWTGASDPNQNAIRYDIYINDQLVERDLAATSYTFDGTSYAESVTAKGISNALAKKFGRDLGDNPFRPSVKKNPAEAYLL